MGPRQFSMIYIEYQRLLSDLLTSCHTICNDSFFDNVSGLGEILSNMSDGKIDQLAP